MRHAKRQRPARLQLLIPAMLAAASAVALLGGCQPAPSATPAAEASAGPVVLPTGAVPGSGSSATPSEPGLSNGPNPSIQIPPPIP